MEKIIYDDSKDEFYIEPTENENNINLLKI